MMSCNLPPDGSASMPATETAAAAEASRSRNREEHLSDSSIDVPPAVDFRGLEVAQPIDENLSCPICHSLLILPVNLPCEHVFCSECLVDALSHQPERSKACPSCRTPTVAALISPAPKIISRILDDIRVKCPFTAMGCSAVVPRCDIQNHVTHYCGFVAIKCPHDGCKMMVERQFSDQSCLHKGSACEMCGKSIMDIDRSRHRRASCTETYDQCSWCKEAIPSTELETHTEHCANTIVQCSASKYGCGGEGTRRGIVQHEQSCPLSKLVPFLEAQATRLEKCEGAVKHLKIKVEIYEEGLTSVQETLRDSLEDSAALAQSSGMDATTPPFESQTAHLLDLHEALQSEVRRISAAVSDLDAKLEVSVLNQTLRANEEKLHRDAVEGQIRKQLQWLVSSRLQANQRATPAMKQPSPATQVGVTTGLTGMSMGSTNPESGIWDASNAPIRRLSDSSRSETKL